MKDALIKAGLIVPRVRIIQPDGSQAHVVVLQTTPDGNDVELVALGAGRTKEEARLRAYEFSQALTHALTNLEV